MDVFYVKISNPAVSLAIQGSIFMDHKLEWREWFLSQYGEIRNAFESFDQSNIPLVSLFFSTSFQLADTYSIGAFIDIGFNTDSRSINAVGASFSKNSSALFISRHVAKFSYLGSKFLVSSKEMGGMHESVSGEIEFEVNQDQFSLKRINIELRFWDNFNQSYEPVETWKTEDYFSRDFIVLCSNCFGEGQSKSMAIPKADYDAGLRNYDLYSSNRINATRGCSKCGGKGVQYESWYLEENPHLKEEIEALEQGWGFVQIKNQTAVVCKELIKTDS